MGASILTTAATAAAATLRSHTYTPPAKNKEPFPFFPPEQQNPEESEKLVSEVWLCKFQKKWHMGGKYLGEFPYHMATRGGSMRNYTEEK